MASTPHPEIDAKLDAQALTLQELKQDFKDVKKIVYPVAQDVAQLKKVVVTGNGKPSLERRIHDIESERLVEQGREQAREEARFQSERRIRRTVTLVGVLVSVLQASAALLVIFL